jgi:hypothetical protein
MEELRAILNSLDPIALNTYLEMKACQENQKVLKKLANRQKILLMYNVILVVCILALLITK